MLTPQDIRDKEFTKAVFGGYDMTSVDDFLEEVMNDYAALYKENNILKGKIKVLVEKVEEYRSTEDAMRMALLTAQKMGDDIIEEANKKRDEMMREAEESASEAETRLGKELSSERARLAAAKRETAAFVSDAKEIVRRYTDAISSLDELALGGAPAPESPVKNEAEAEEELENTIRGIDEAVEKALENTPDEMPVQAVDDVENAPRPEWTEEDEYTTPRPKFNFDDLQFGSNYKEE